MPSLWLLIPLLLNTFARGWEIPFLGREYDAFFEDLSCSSDNLFVTTLDFIAKNNYTSESHEVTTDDGYLLTLHRIGHGQGHVEKRPVVFLMHCIIASSSIWVMYGRNRSLAFKLVDAGYDVWMGNARGNTYSRAHRTLDPNDKEYWDFSWHEVGVYDLPASIDYILAHTGQERLHYIGYSMGTTVFYVMLAERPEYNDKVVAMHGWGPIAFMAHIDAPGLIQYLGYTDRFENVFDFLGIYELSPTNRFVSRAIQLACFGKPNAYVSNLCEKALILVFDIDPGDTEPDTLPILFGQLPAGGSLKQLIHYGQIIRNKRFTKFDHGIAENLKVYGQSTAPAYDLGRVTVPVVSYLGSYDNLATRLDCERLNQFFKCHDIVEVEAANFNHLSFLIAPNLEELLHRHVLAMLRKFVIDEPEDVRGD